MAKKWAAFPYPDKAYVYDAAGLRKNWAPLRRCEPMPKETGRSSVASLPRRRVRRRGGGGSAKRGAGIDPAVKAQMIRSCRKVRQMKLASRSPQAGRTRAATAEERERALLLRVRARSASGSIVTSAGARLR
jgi:hypothetical protein